MVRRMAKGLQHTAENVAHSVWLQAASRIGVPLLLAAAMWFGSTVVSIERRMAQAEQADREMVRRVETLEQRREADLNDYRQLERRIQETTGTIRSDLAAIRADQAALLRALTRVEQNIDRTAAR